MRCAPPRFGQDSAQVLLESGYSAVQIEQLRALGAVSAAGDERG